MAQSTTVPSSPVDIRKQRRSRRRTLSSSASTKSTFSSQYEINGTVPLGEGAYGSVFECTHRITEIECAVKIIYKSQGQVAKKVVREIEVYYQCQESTNILHLVELFEDEEKFYLVFELIRGGSLEARIAQISDDGRLSERSVQSLVKSIALALQFLHAKGIAHRDIKPANILLPNSNSLEGAKLCDFDLASRSRSTEFRGDLCMSSPVGSAEFMAPEVVRAFTASHHERVLYDQRCDVWSLGVITYSLLTGKAPFEGCCGKDCGWDEGDSCDECMDLLFLSIQKGQLRFPENEWKNISPEAINLISRCLANDPINRPSPDQILKHKWFSDDHDHLNSSKVRTSSSTLPFDEILIKTA